MPGSGSCPEEGYLLQYSWASLVAQNVKYLPKTQETWVQSLSWEDPLEEGMATHSGILAWRIPWTEEPGRLQSMGLQSVRHDWATKHSIPQGIPSMLSGQQPDIHWTDFLYFKATVEWTCNIVVILFLISIRKLYIHTFKCFLFPGNIF